MSGLSFQYPWALALLLLLPWTVRLRRHFSPTTAFSGTALLAHRLEASFFKKHGQDIAGLLFCITLVFATANLQYSQVWEEERLESKWIMLVQDLSGSMGRASGQDSSLTLGDVALAGARSFIDLRHPEDLIGIVAFSSYAKLVVPPTFDRRILEQKLQLLSRSSDSILFRELSAGGATNAAYATWLALAVFFMLLPEKHQLSHEEITDFRHALLGKTLDRIELPEKLRKVDFGQGMAIVLFTDGRIEINKDGANRGFLNFVNVIQLLKKLGIHLYMIVVDDDMQNEVKTVFHGQNAKSGFSRIFTMPRQFSEEKIREMYKIIHQLEKNQLLVKILEKKQDTRWLFNGFAFAFFLFYCFADTLPWLKRLS